MTADKKTIVELVTGIIERHEYPDRETAREKVGGLYVTEYLTTEEHKALTDLVDRVYPKPVPMEETMIY